MWPFKKKPEPPALIELPPCKHKWQDFPAYLDYGREDSVLKIWIKEPYVCIYCKKRVDKLLVNDTFYGISQSRADELLTRYRKDYASLLKPVGIVEDMVNDYQLVDREWLDITRRLRSAKEGGN